MTRAFTLLELLCVIGIIALICALGVPAIKAISLGSTRYTITPSQFVQEINLARQKAIATRLDTYVLFCLQAPSANSMVAGIYYSTNEQTCQSWCIAQNGQTGDQPGRHAFHQISSWHTLPDNVFFNVQSFIDNQTPFIIPQWSKDYGKPLNAIMPLSHVNIGGSSALPCIGFRGGSGALMNNCPEFIVLDTGAHYWQPDTRSTNTAYTVIEIDCVGRAEIEQEKVR